MDHEIRGPPRMQIRRGRTMKRHLRQMQIGGGKTIYFENKPDGMEAALRAEYAKRHP